MTAVPYKIDGYIMETYHYTGIAVETSGNYWEFRVYDHNLDSAWYKNHAPIETKFVPPNIVTKLLDAL